MTTSPEQCRAARILLKWKQSDLSEAAGIGLSTIADFERGARKPHASTLTTIRAALETAGVTFIDGDDTSGPGVHLRAPGKK